MSVDFFKTECKSTINSPKFGLCDNEEKHAYIDTDYPDDWLGEVNNSKKKEVDFIAIDKCLNIIDSSGNQESTCDCLLRSGKQLIFVELKSRKRGRWVRIGREQITKTITLFKKSHSIEQYKVEAHICNNKRPRSHIGHAVNIQQFKDETGYILSTNKTIEIK